jgi:glycosyltransferase involved in cell wall biosynthesis
MRRVLKGLAESRPSVVLMEWLLALWLNLVSMLKPLDKFAAKVTVVVPAFNVESFIAQAMRSLAAQRYKNLSVILVDDHCTDRSIERARPFEKRFNLTIVRGTHDGLGAARNTGIDQVNKTDYIIFLDSDDVMVPGTISKLARLAQKFGADMVNGQSAKFVGLGIFPRRDTRFLYRGRREELLTLESEPKMIYDSTPWNKLIRWDFWKANKLSWPLHVYFEDLIVSSKIMALGAKVVLTPKIVYLWRVRVNATRSITQTHAELRTLRDRVSAARIATANLKEALAAGRITQPTIDALQEKLRTHDLEIYLPHYPNPTGEAKELMDEFKALAGVQ